MVQSSKAKASVETIELEGMDVAVLTRACCTKYYITAHVDSSDAPYRMFKRLGDFVQARNAHILAQYVFGGCKFYDKGIEEISNSCGNVQWPVTWIQGDGCSGENLTATQAYTITDSCYKPLTYKGDVVGALYEDEDAQYCLIGDVMPDDVTASNTAQSLAALEKIEHILASVGMDFTNVVRTWMYLNNLLTWYDQFNEVRNNFFTQRGVFDGVVPASTGVGVCNPAGAALVTDVFAVKLKTDQVKIQAIPSPLQCPAIDYKSSFSRAVEVAVPDHRTIYISGTASIEPSGKTVHIDDTEKQIKLTMEVADAILKSRKMDFSDTVRAIAYFKDMKDVPLFTKYCRDNALPKMPVALSHSDICRHDLLFEIELDAIKTDTF